MIRTFGLGDAVFVIDRSELRFTVVVAEELLFVLFGSAESLATDAVFVTEAPLAVEDGTAAWIVTEAVPPAATVPRLNEPVQTVDGVQAKPVQYFPVVSGDGSVSESVTFAASDGPPFETVKV